MNTLTTRFILALGLLMATSTSIAAGNDLHVIDPWVREAPPMSNVLAGYMVLENKGSRNRVLIDVSSPSFERVEMHKTRIQDDIAKMLRQDSITIPTGEKMAFESGGYHLMLIGPSSALRTGDQVDFSLSFADGETIRITANVRKMMADMGEMHDMGNMKNMQMN